MKKLLILLFSILISFNAYSDVNDIYVCEEKEFNKAGYKAKLVLFWDENSMTKKDRVEDDSVDTSDTYPFVVNEKNYFVAMKPKYEGHIIKTFDGETYASYYIKDSYTFISEYNCEKF